MVAVASFAVCAALMMCGWTWAVGVFLVTALLSWLLFPGGVSILYAAFFGYYPIAKSFFERIHSQTASWACKYGLYTAVFVLYWLLARALFSFTGQELPWYILYPIGAVAFFLYDWCFSLLIRFYIVKIARYFTT